MKAKLVLAILIVGNFQLFSLSRISNLTKDFIIHSTDTLIPTINDPLINSNAKGCIILSENSNILISGDKTRFLKYAITKKIRIKIFNKKGVEKISKITLPELFDPNYYSHSTEARNVGNYYSNFKINYFKVFKIGTDGIKSIINPIEIIENVKTVIEQNKYISLVKTHYEIETIQPGDIVELEFEFELPYIENFSKLSSLRVFFNGDIYKDHFSLKLSYPIDLTTEINFLNGAKPDSIETDKQRKTYFWERKKLHGCIDEPNSRPYLSLPYFVISIKPIESLYTLPYSYEEKFIPFYVFAVYSREMSFLSILKSSYQGVKNSQYSQIDKFINEETAEIESDSFNLKKLTKIHNSITNNFAFTNDVDFFKGNDIREERIGDHLSAKKIRDISRYSTYVALISKIGLNYYTGYLMDKRIGELSKLFITPMFESDFLIVPILKNNEVRFIYPKKSKFGYYINELPFYFEDTKTRLIYIDDYMYFKKPIEEEFRLIMTPSAKKSENLRKSNVLVTVDLDNLNSKFDAKIILSGQYSTLTRGSYKCDFKDASVNKKYSEKIWEIGVGSKLIKQVFTSEEYEAPFKTNIKAQYTSDGLIKKEDGSYTISLNKLFNHVLNIDSSEYRFLDFYPDFQGIDSYTYFFQFPKNIKLKKVFEKVEIKNNFGELIISIDQPQAATIRITSHFSIDSDKVDADKINDVVEIFNEIQKLNCMNLEFVVHE